MGWSRYRHCSIQVYALFVFEDNFLIFEMQHHNAFSMRKEWKKKKESCHSTQYQASHKRPLTAVRETIFLKSTPTDVTPKPLPKSLKQVLFCNAKILQDTQLTGILFCFVSFQRERPSGEWQGVTPSSE